MEDGYTPAGFVSKLQTYILNSGFKCAYLTLNFHMHIYYRGNKQDRKVQVNYERRDYKRKSNHYH